jgi:hypothetical protein
MVDIFNPKNPQNYSCDFCDFSSSNKKDYNRHLLTLKHKKETNGGQVDETENYEKHTCLCGREYKCRQGLWKHKKNCSTYKPPKKTPDKEPESELKILTSLVLEVVKQNQELVNQNSELTNKIVDICKVGQTTNSITNSNINSHNKTFNLNVFLNETCKDAMNITDFVESLKLQLSDLEKVGELGYVEGISKIIVKNLKELDVTQRPVHCTDQKRETMYIKDEDKWEKDEERLKMHKVVRRVTCKNQNLIPKFKEIHPDYNKYHSKVSDQYNKIIVESMGGSGDNDFEKEEKIIKNISKQVFIDKESV